MKSSSIATILLTMMLASCNHDTLSTAQQESTPSTTLSQFNKHTSQNSLDWQGVYKGTVPCASCLGIKTELRLSENGNYTLKETYLDEDKADFRTSGTFIWQSNGSVIALQQASGKPRKLLMSEGAVYWIDNTEDKSRDDRYKLLKQ